MSNKFEPTYDLEWQTWFDIFINAAQNAGPNHIPEEHVRMMNHAFVAGWNCMRLVMDNILRSPVPAEMKNAMIDYLGEGVKKYALSVEEDHKIEDDIRDMMDEINPSPETN